MGGPPPEDPISFYTCAILSQVAKGRRREGGSLRGGSDRRFTSGRISGTKDSAIRLRDVACALRICTQRGEGDGWFARKTVANWLWWGGRVGPFFALSCTVYVSAIVCSRQRKIACGWRCFGVPHALLFADYRALSVSKVCSV